VEKVNFGTPILPSPLSLLIEGKEIIGKAKRERDIRHVQCRNYLERVYCLSEVAKG
jgi:hypothetical protein